MPISFQTLTASYNISSTNMLLDAQQDGSDKGRVTITDRPMYKPASPYDGVTITPVAVDAHAGVWLALLLFTTITGWVIGDLLHTAGLWLIDCLTMPFGIFQPVAALFSSLLGFTMEATSVAVSSLPSVDGLCATTAFSTGVTTSAAPFSTAVSWVWSMERYVFRTAFSWLFAIVVSSPKAVLSSICQVAFMLVIGIPRAIISSLVRVVVMLLLGGYYGLAYPIMAAHYCLTLVKHQLWVSAGLTANSTQHFQDHIQLPAVLSSSDAQACAQ